MQTTTAIWARGGPWAPAGVCAGAVVAIAAFIIARVLGRDADERLTGTRSVERLLRDRRLMAVIRARRIPVVPATVVWLFFVAVTAHVLLSMGGAVWALRANARLAGEEEQS